MAKNGDFYWVLAHVTPSHDLQGSVDGYHSNRRLPGRNALAVIEPLYKRLLAEEQRQADRKLGMQAGAALLNDVLRERQQGYDEFVLGLATMDCRRRRRAAGPSRQRAAG